MSGDIILETRELTKEFKGFVAVNEVDLRVERGNIHALIGPNGAGKTTCFNLLTKFLPPTAGQILFNGHDITHETPAQIARRGIIRSFQISAVFPHLTVLENVRVGAAAQAGHLVPFLAAASARSTCSTTRALRTARRGRPAALRRHCRRSSCSYGRKRALEIATTLAMEPELMLLDEPTQGMGHEDVDRVTPADQEGLGRPHHPDGRAQHERGRQHRRHASRCCSAARCWPKARTPRCRRTRR